MVKNLPAMQETWVRSLGQEDTLEKEMATYSSILAWEKFRDWPKEKVGLPLRGDKDRVGTGTMVLEGVCGRTRCSSHCGYLGDSWSPDTDGNSETLKSQPLSSPPAPNPLRDPSIIQQALSTSTFSPPSLPALLCPQLLLYLLSHH